MKVIIVGAGKVGYYLAKTLLEHGYTITIIETDKDICKTIANELDVPIINGDGTVIDVLKDAGCSSADSFVSVTGKDETNLIACQLAKRVFQVENTVAKVNNPKNTEVIRKLGIDNAISSTDNIARLFERELDAKNIKQLISLNKGESSISEIHLPKNYKLNGKLLSDIKMPVDSVVISITRNGSTIIPRGNTALCSEDTILIMSKNSVLHKINEVLKLK